MQYAHELKAYSLEEMRDIISNAKCDAVYLHWSAGRYGQVYEDYHISIDYDGRIYLPYNCENLNVHRTHTYMRNTGACAIAICGCYGARANNGYDCDFGDYPPTEAQVETLALLVAMFNQLAGVSMDNILTHYEAACLDGYGVPYGTWVNGVYQSDSDCRWDLWFLNDYNGEMRNGGDVIRGKANWYMQH